ncbi:MAG: hypothetical protein AVDCRST_MAG22-3138, partial [uncultured Rubrobacteraceae bacterium]
WRGGATSSCTREGPGASWPRCSPSSPQTSARVTPTMRGWPVRSGPRWNGCALTTLFPAGAGRLGGRRGG